MQGAFISSFNKRIYRYITIINIVSTNIHQCYDRYSSLYDFPCYIHSMQTFWERVILLLHSPTVVDLATMLEVKRSTLSSWIHTDRRPPLDISLKIEQLTGVSLEKLERGLDWEANEEEEAAESVPNLRKRLQQQIEYLEQPELEHIWRFIQYSMEKDLRNRDRKEPF